MTKTATSYQVGGDHYLKMGMQPSRFSMANAYDSDAFLILKYVSRHRRRNGLEDVKKAIHFHELRISNAAFIRFPHPAIFTMNHYIETNDFDMDTQIALHNLHDWQQSGDKVGERSEAVLFTLNNLAASYDTGEMRLPL